MLISYKVCFGPKPILYSSYFSRSAATSTTSKNTVTVFLTKNGRVFVNFVFGNNFLFSVKLHIYCCHKHRIIVIFTLTKFKEADIFTVCMTKIHLFFYIKTKYNYIYLGKWSCESCTYLNSADQKICEMCSKSREPKSYRASLMESYEQPKQVFTKVRFNFY